MKTRITSLFLFLIGYSCFAFESDLVSERPGQALTPICLKRGHVQIQSGYEYSESKYTGYLPHSVLRSNYTSKFGLSNTVVRFGLGEKFEINSTFNYLTVDEEFQTPLVGFKMRLLNTDNHIASIQYNTTITQIHEEAFVNSLMLITTHNLGNQFSFSFNGGYTYLPSIDETQTSYVLSLGYAPTKRIALVLEQYGTYNGDFDAFFDAGIGFLILPNLQIDTYFGGGINDDYEYLFVNGGITYRFGV